jgi:hypothetical protein
MRNALHLSYFLFAFLLLHEAAAGDATTASAVISVSVYLDSSPPTIAISAPSASRTTSGPVSYTIVYGGANTITLWEAA